MKRTFALTLCLGLALPLIANADPKDKEDKQRRKAEKRAEKIEKMIAKRDEKRGRNEARGRDESWGRDDSRDDRRDERRQAEMDAQMRERMAQRDEREPQPIVSAGVNTEVRRREYRERASERRGPRNYAWSYDEARRYQQRDRRDREWWRSRYNRFTLFGGGYYYWDRGYWYPAYGYDTRYNTYAYDEPIYGYNYMEPRQVMVRVQRELRREGYYRGAIDGLIGPMTRAALARFQNDAGLRVTRRIDGPTLAALGVV